MSTSIVRPFHGVIPSGHGFEAYSSCRAPDMFREDVFENYRCDPKISLGMEVNHLSSVMNFAKDDDIIFLRAEDEGGDAATFMFESSSPDKILRFKMKLIDIYYQELAIPEADHHAIVSMPSTKFANICKDLSSVGDRVVISVITKGFKFSTTGNIGTVDVVCKQNTATKKPGDATVIEMYEPLSMNVALRFLNSVTNATPLSNMVTISLSSNLPLMVEYKIAEIGSHIRFHLAPKVV